MSIDSLEDVSTTIGSRFSPGCERIHPSTSSPERRGSLRSSNTSTGNGYASRSANGLSPDRYATASSPFDTVRTGFRMRAFPNARWIRRTSFGSSSTTRITWPELTSVLARSRLELDPEPAAVTGIRFDPHLASHALHRLAHDREPDARPRVVIIGMQPLEHAKDPRLMLGSDADAVVFYPHAHQTVVSLGVDAQLRSALRWHELQPVAEQIGEHLRQRRRMAYHRGQGLVDVDAGVAGAQRAAQLGERAVRHRRQGNLHQLQLGTADAAVGEQIADQLVHTLRSGDDALGVFPAHGVEPVTAILEQRLAEALHRAQRRAQIVRDRIPERLELVVALFELGGPLADLVLEAGVRFVYPARHRRERRGELADFVVAVNRHFA